MVCHVMNECWQMLVDVATTRISSYRGLPGLAVAVGYRILSKIIFHVRAALTIFSQSTY